MNDAESPDKKLSFISKEILISFASSVLVLGLGGLYTLGKQTQQIANNEWNSKTRHLEQEQAITELKGQTKENSKDLQQLKESNAHIEEAQKYFQKLIEERFPRSK